MHQALQILLLVGGEPANQGALSVDSVAAVEEVAVVQEEVEADVAELVKLVTAYPKSMFPAPNLITLNQPHHRPNLQYHLLYLPQL